MLKNSNPRFGIVTAMPLEMNEVESYVSGKEIMEINGFNYCLGSIAEQSIVSIIGGIGQVNAALSTSALIHQFNPDYLLFSGIAGDVSTQLNMGDIVVGETVLSAELLSFQTPENKKICLFGEIPSFQYLADSFLLKKARLIAGNFDKTVNFGVIASSDFFPVPAHLPKTFNEQVISAIDMESAAFSQTCHRLNKPCLVVRGISNHVGESLTTLDAVDINKASQSAAYFINELIQM